MFDPTTLFTDRVRAIDASGIRRVFDLAAKIENPINLSIGQPDFDVPAAAKRAAVDAIEAGHNKYTQTQGIAPLRARIAADVARDFAQDGRWDDFGTLITSGVSGGLLLSMLACVEPGDEVLVPDPYFVMYKHLVTLAGGRSVFVDTYPDLQLTAARVEPLMTARTKLLLLASPSNPTGVVTPPGAMAELVDLCRSRGVLLVSDEIYDHFCYEPIDAPAGPRAPSPAMFSDALLLLGGFTKRFAMTGWRVGYAVGPVELIEQMAKLQQYTFVCAPSMAQHAALEAMGVDMSAQFEAYRRKRDMVVDALADRFELVAPGGAFYAFPKVPTGETATAFVERAIEKDLLIIPGSVFSERDTHFRLSYACDEATLSKGLSILNELAR